MTDEVQPIQINLLFGDGGTVELRQIPFNHRGLDIYFHLDDDNQELTIAGMPSGITQEELAGDIESIFTYLIEVLRDEGFKDELDGRG